MKDMGSSSAAVNLTCISPGPSDHCCIWSCSSSSILLSPGLFCQSFLDLQYAVAVHRVDCKYCCVLCRKHGFLICDILGDHNFTGTISFWITKSEEIVSLLTNNNYGLKTIRIIRSLFTVKASDSCLPLSFHTLSQLHSWDTFSEKSVAPRIRLPVTSCGTYCGNCCLFILEDRS